MGCVSSKDHHQKVCQNCQAPYSSSSPSGINIYSSRSNPNSINIKELDDDQKKKMNDQVVIMDFPMATAVIEAKNWSEMIEKKIPKILSTTTQDMSSSTPSSVESPETINTWELMEGLEDNNIPFSFKGQSSSSSGTESNSMSSSVANSELDKEEISSFRKELEELNPANPFHLNPLMLVSTEETIYKKKSSTKLRVVLYFTTLRGVRKTYKDCCYVRVTLRELGFIVDERDVSMHSGFKGELLNLTEEGLIELPKVFVGKKCIGGADEIRHLHEEGEMEKALEGCEKSSPGSRRKVCEGCGDIGFVPCETCCGSCKIFYEHDEDFYYEEEEEEECDESEYGFQRCPDCNENGLIRCPICCDDY